MTRPLYQALAGKVSAYLNCIASGNAEWRARHQFVADYMVEEAMPSGSGFDSGTTLDWDASRSDKLVFKTAFHHMNDVGYYTRWTEHTVTVRADLCSGFTLLVGGKDHRDIKDYIAECFHQALSADAPAEPAQEAA